MNRKTTTEGAPLVFPPTISIEMPLFPDETTIGIVVLGRDRAHEWPAIAKRLEKEVPDPLPPVDPIVGARFWPAVFQFFRRRYAVDRLEQIQTRAGDIRIVPPPFGTR